jgi:tetratricopeptide (TPR) repeat protein
MQRALLVSFCVLTACALTAAAETPGLVGNAVTTDARIKLFEGWVAADPASIGNKTLLASAYVQKTRETTDFSYLNRASQLIQQVLAEKPDYQARKLRTLIELNLHHFTQAAEYARELTRANPGDPQNWGSLGDALIEMGEYDAGREAFQKMLAIRANLFSLNRMAYYRFITGDVESAISMMRDAVSAGSNAAATVAENKAWCLVELGNMLFKTGQLVEAAAAYREAIAVFPTSHAAYAGLGAVQAGQGTLNDAVASYKHAQSITPMVQYAGALQDLYAELGRSAEAKQQAALVDVTAKLEAAAGQSANRTLALIYANQERALDESLQLARADLQIRHDVYTQDALSWALYKNHQYHEAAAASEQALKLGTPEALFFYHAGMIAHALGDDAAARVHLGKALQLNPAFDIRQAGIARKILAGLP